MDVAKIGKNRLPPGLVVYVRPLGKVQITVPSAGGVSQSMPLARFEPKDGDMTANRVCLEAIVTPTGVDLLR